MAFRPESVVSAESVEAESAEVSADASVLSALLSALSALLSVADVSDVAVFRNGMVQPPGMYTPVTAVTPRKMMISMTAIKEVTLFFTCKCLLYFFVTQLIQYTA